MTSIDAVLLDIEGTLSSQSYVASTLFPFSRRRIPGFVAKHIDVPAVQQVLADTAALAEPGEDPVTALIRWIDEDRKAAPLKTIGTSFRRARCARRCSSSATARKAT